MTNAVAGFNHTAARTNAARLAARADLEDIRLFSSTVELLRFPRQGRSLTFDFEAETAVDYETGNEAFIACYDYELTISDGEVTESDDEETPVVASVTFRMGGLVSVNLDGIEEAFSEDEVDAYMTTTIQFAMYPFAREYVYDVTGRLGLPALTMGVLRMPSPMHPELAVPPALEDH